MNSKNKGSSFERLISKELSLFFSKGEDNKLFWRTINSGGFSKNNIIEDQVGDITTLKKNINTEKFIELFYLELKHYKQIDLFNILTNNSLINKWMKKLHEENINNKIPFIIFKQNNKKICILSDIRLEIMLSDLNLKYNFKLLINNEYYYLYKFEDFIKIDINKFIEKLFMN